MTELAKGIGLLRSFTNRAARLMWVMIALAAVVTWWSLLLVSQDETGGLAAYFGQLCRIGEPPSGVASIVAAFLLWAAMSLAMMLPSALPMISAYLDISDAAGRNNKAVVSARYLVAGYLAIWLAFAAAATALQSIVELTPAMALANEHHAALLLLLAGIYQFAPLKHACLVKCRMPMPYFFAHWSDHMWGVFRMGVGQGILCLACCWALMLLMFAAGLMNLMWMAGLSILIALEKTLPAPKPVVYGSGAGLIAAGLFFLWGS
jgi:predicted metal-binding membrane protein